MEYKDFFFQALIYLLAGILSVPLAKRFGLSAVLGYLIAGIVIGPYVLGVIHSNHQNIMHFSEFGIVMMLFLVGLELKPALIWKLRTQIMGMGVLQILMTTLAIGFISYAVLGSWEYAVTIGMILSLSSTAIVLQIFTEKNWIKSPIGQASFSVLLFQDIAIVPIMAILSLLTASKVSLEIQNDWHSLSGWLKPIAILGMIAGIILIGKFLMRPVFRIIAEAKLREIFTATALLLVIANALAMELVGLSPALGSFLAGVVLAESEYRHELESDIEPFKSLLLGLFFISVGANINFDLVFQNPILIFVLVISLILIKAVILFIVAKSFKQSLQNSLLFSIALAQGGEFCFVLFSYSKQNQIIPANITDLLIVVVAISMLFAPFLINLYERLVASYLIRIQPKDTFDDIESDENSVIIAGFGRFGQIVGRLLMANRIKATILDLDSQHVELVRRFGFKVFYGDASRMELLIFAGLAKAKLLILAIDDSTKALEIAFLVRKHYPQLKILIRARGRTDAMEYYKHNFEYVFRETFESALAMGVRALRALGFSGHHAVRCAHLFRSHDEERIKQLSQISVGEKEYIDDAKQSRKNLEEAFIQDRLNTLNSVDLAWDKTNAEERG